MILPFAGLELAALAAGLYLGALRGRWCEVISIRGDVVAVEKGMRRPKQSLAFARGWTRIELDGPPHRGYPSRLLIRCREREVEIGGCLNDVERSRLADHLRRWIKPVSVPLAAA